MLKMSHFTFFGDGMTHGDATISVTFADMIKHSALALIGRQAALGLAQDAQPLFPDDAGMRDETGQRPMVDAPSWFEPSSHGSSRLPSDSPLRADIGLLPLDNF
jgi:hypothetical protein